MALYIFHVCLADGASPTFEAHDLASDDAVLIRTKEVLDRHRSCDHVTVWRDDDFVMRLERRGEIPQRLRLV